jgi:methanogenic corrinoid protein MtbC1
LLRANGQHVIYLGTSTPLDDLNKIHKLHNPDFVFCALTNSNAAMPVQVYLNTLSRSWPNTQIIVTGSQVVKRRDLKIPENCRVMSDPTSFLEFIVNN